jgi:hypothetical protein
MERKEMRKTKRAGLLALVLWVCLLLLPGVPVLAQDLTLNMSDNTYAATINSDGTVDIVQDLTFYVEPGSVPLDYVDVGLPNDTYDLSQVSASLDGVPLTGISRSSSIPHGVKVVLDPMIQPGQSGTLHVQANVRDVLYQDTSDETYASINLSPTYFDSQYMTGSGRLEVQLHFPTGVTPEEPRWHDQEPTEKYYQDDRAVYAWIAENDSGSQQHTFGASFPKSYVPADVVQKPPSFHINLGSICSSPGWICGLIFLGWAGFTALGAVSKRKRKLDYLPPQVAVEGTGIKRGLTAVEAAVLLEAPLNKVLIMILFGLVKKGALTVEEEKPLKVKAADPLQADVKLWDYEQSFLGAIKPDGLMDEKKLHDMIITLIGDVNKKLTGFSRKETQAYYKDIAARAWKEVEAAATPEVLGQAWSDGLEWTMLDDDWDHHTQRVFQDRPVVLPTWWWGYRPWATAAGVPAPVHGPAAAGGGSIPVTLPTLPGAAFANSVVRGVENAANSVVSSVERFTGGVSDKTNPPPKTTSSGTKSYGGGKSCACACACACAGCACACAGGGR